MKFSVLLCLAAAAGASAFTSPQTTGRPTALFAGVEKVTIVSGGIPGVAELKAEAPVTSGGKSKAVPFVNANPVLDGSYPGDAGFDPLFLSENPTLLNSFREAEIRHARLAMLAAAGWPISELFDKPIASVVNEPAVIDTAERAPSVLNGGLSKTPNAYWGAALLFASFVECATIYKSRKNKDYYPGNLGFDPLGLYPDSVAGKREMQLKEIKNGRLAMLAITGFAFQEAVQQESVINQTPIFFKPFFT